MKMAYQIQTRNWNGTEAAKNWLDLCAKKLNIIPGTTVEVFRSAAGDNDDKYLVTTDEKELSLMIKKLFENSGTLTGGSTYYYENV